jgi:hypothetical protein
MDFFWVFFIFLCLSQPRTCISNVIKLCHGLFCIK